MIGFNFTFDCQLFLFETEASYHLTVSFDFFAVRRRGKHFVQRGDVLAYTLTQ